MSRDHGDPHRRAEEGSLIVLPEINTEFQSGIPDLESATRSFSGSANNSTYFYADLDRQAPLVWLAILFVIVVFAHRTPPRHSCTRLDGRPVFVLVVFIAPSVLDGNDRLRSPSSPRP